MEKKRRNPTWPQTGEMTDVEVKCHDMEANTAVRIVDNQVLKRSPFNWVVNKRKRKKQFFPPNAGRLAVARRLQTIYVAACKGQKQKMEKVKIPPTFPRLKSLQSKVNRASENSPGVTFRVQMPPSVLK